MGDYNEKMAESFMDMAGKEQMRHEETQKKLDTAIELLNAWVNSHQGGVEYFDYFEESRKFINENTPKIIEKTETEYKNQDDDLPF